MKDLQEFVGHRTPARIRHVDDDVLERFQDHIRIMVHAEIALPPFRPAAVGPGVVPEDGVEDVPAAGGAGVVPGAAAAPVAGDKLRGRLPPYVP